MQPIAEQETREHLSPVAARMILAALPDKVRKSFKRRAAEIEYPVEAVLEMRWLVSLIVNVSVL